MKKTARQNILLTLLMLASTAAIAEEADLTSWILEDDTSISGTISFWMPFNGSQGMDALIADFNSIYPNITIELNTYNNNSDGNMSVNTSILAGEVDVLASFGAIQCLYPLGEQYVCGPDGSN